MGGIFISYRRDDSLGFSGRLEHDLSRCFGGALVFRDREIPPGADFARHIEGQLGQAEVVLVVIGRHWLDAVDAVGRRRLEQPDDWVRREIELALRHGMPVIPVLVGGVSMPSPSELPPSLVSMARFQAHALSDLRWHDDVQTLCQGLVELVPRLGEARQQQASDPPVMRQPVPEAVRPWRAPGWLLGLGRQARGAVRLALLAGGAYVLVRALGGAAINRNMDRVFATLAHEVGKLF